MACLVVPSPPLTFPRTRHRKLFTAIGPHTEPMHTASLGDMHSLLSSNRLCHTPDRHPREIRKEAALQELDGLYIHVLRFSIIAVLRPLAALQVYP